MAPTFRLTLPLALVAFANGGRQLETGELEPQTRRLYETISWSPDGRQLALTARIGDGFAVYLMQVDRTAMAVFGEASSSALHAAWSPDGARVAYASDRGGNLDIYVGDPDGRNGSRLTTDPGADVHPSWSPDGTRIAFGSDRDGLWQIYVMNADGSDVSRVTHTSGNDYNPTWSPKGDVIVFESDRQGDGLRVIYLIRPDGKDERRLTGGRTNDVSPSWSPDATKLVYCSVWHRQVKVQIMNSDGSNSRELATGCWPSWAPDGPWIAFVGDAGTSIYLLNVNGGRPRRLFGR